MLLILATVAIREVQGDGIISKAREAKNEYAGAQAKEKVALQLEEWKILKHTQVDANLAGFLAEKFGAENVATNEDGTYTVTVDGYEVTVDADGNVTGIANNNNNNTEDIPEVITNYTAEEIEASEYLYAIGKTVSTYVIAKFNEDYTQVTITKNGQDSDGLSLEFASWADTSPMTTHASTLETAIIEQGITNIATYTFYGCTSLTNITIPNSVTSIGYNAFSNCTGLTSIEIPNSVTYIDGNAFNGCTNLSNIIMSNNLQDIGDGVFNNTAWYNNHPNGVVYLGKMLYKYKGEMPENTEIEIIDGIKIVSLRAFEHCEGLSTITIPNSVTTIGSTAFKGCTNLTSITMSNNIISVGYEAFENTAWYDNQPNGVVYIGKVLYKYKGEMPSNTEIEIPEGIKTISHSAFQDYINLTKISIPNSVNEICSSAFWGCTGLTSIVIPGSVEKMGQYVFASWTNTQTINCRANKIPTSWWENWASAPWSSTPNANINWGYTGE